VTPRCPSCGDTHEPKANFCAKCGRPLREGTAITSSDSEKTLTFTDRIEHKAVS
jgi:uncharacterized OB-fold protein